MSCAASRAKINYMQDNNLADQSAAKGAGVMEALGTIEPKNASIGEVRGLGLMVGIEIVEDAES